MTTSTPIQVGGVVSRPRTAWAREGGARRRYSAARVRAALRGRLREGWLPLIPSGKSPHERVTILWHEHPLAGVARAYLAGGRWFERASLEEALGHRPDCRAGADALAAAG